VFYFARNGVGQIDDLREAHFIKTTPEPCINKMLVFPYAMTSYFCSSNYGNLFHIMSALQKILLNTVRGQLRVRISYLTLT
jgi:hypothetical protein